MAAAPVDPAGSSVEPSRSRRLVGALHPQRYLAVGVGVVWLVVSAIVLARPPAGVSETAWRLGFAWSPLIGLGMIASAARATQLRLTSLGIHRPRPRRQSIPWEAVAQLKITARRDWFHLVPGLGWWVTSTDRVYPAVITTGGEQVLLAETGFSLTGPGLERARRLGETIVAYGELPPLTSAGLDSYRSLVQSDDASRWLDR